VRYQECDCGGEVDTADHDERYVATCESCRMAFEVFPDAEWDDGMWRDCSTMRRLRALPAPDRYEYERAVQRLKEDAMRAEELFGVDECERYAEQLRKGEGTALQCSASAAILKPR